MASPVPTETKERIAQLLLAGKKVVEVRRMLAAEGLRAGEHTIARQADRLGIVLQRGPRPGEGGRPPLGVQARARRALSMEPAIWALLEMRRRAGESLSSATQRILLDLLGAHQTNNAVQ